MPGLRYKALPVPLIREHTKFFPAGDVTFAVERRELNEERLVDAFADHPEELEIAREFRNEQAHEGQSIDLEGFVSLHVLGPDGLEYLRFDCIEGDPHFHYIYPTERANTYFPYDPVTNGYFLDWLFDRLPVQLRQMLRTAEAPDVTLQESEVVVQLRKVETEMRSMLDSETLRYLGVA